MATQATLNFTKLSESSIKPYVQSLFVESKGSAEKFALANKELGILKDFLIAENPLLSYAKDINVSAKGEGSITVKRNSYGTAWRDKATLGNGTINNVEMESVILEWNKPQVMTEGMSAYDLSKGAENVLGQRLATNGTKFVQESIKKGFEELESKGGTPVSLSPSEATDYKALRLKLVQAATRLVKETQRPRNMITITVEPEIFDGLAESGLIGDRANITFTSGQYAVGIMGGYRVQSGSMFLPNEVVAIIGTSDAMAFNTQIVAANTGKLGISNDLGTYLEMASIAKAPKFTETDGLVKVFKLGTVKQAQAQTTPAPAPRPASKR